MTALAAAGVTVGGPPDYRARFWIAAPDRRVAWIADGEANWLPPVPGDASIMVVDVCARDPLAVLADGSAWRCLAATRERTWISERSLLVEGGSVAKEGTKREAPSESLVLGGVERGEQGRWRVWGVTATRKIVCANENMSARDVATAVPGSAPILAVRLMGDLAAEVLTADGVLLQSGPRGWTRVADVLAEGGANAKIRARESFCFAPGKDVQVGEVFEVPPAEARRLIASGRAERVPLDAS